MKTAFALVVCMSLSACATDDGESVKAFRGTYTASLTLSGSGSQTFNDTLTIDDGQTADLIVSSRQLGSMKATIIGANAFTFDQQQITLTDGSGRSFSVTLQGQGTVNNGVLAASGQLLSNNGTLSLTINGSRQ